MRSFSLTPEPRELIDFDPAEWTALAACRGMDTALFFPLQDDPLESIDAARAVCTGCTVRVACLDYAITNHERGGVWGGMSERERRAERRRRRAVADRLLGGDGTV